MVAGDQAIFGVLVVGAIGGVVYSRQKKKKKAQEQKEQEEEQKGKQGIQKGNSTIDEAKKRAQGILAYYQQFVAEKVVPPPRPSAPHRFGAGGWTGGSEGLCSRFVHVCGR